MAAPEVATSRTHLSGDRHGDSFTLDCHLDFLSPDKTTPPKPALTVPGAPSSLPGALEAAQERPGRCPHGPPAP